MLAGALDRLAEEPWDLPTFNDVHTQPIESEFQPDFVGPRHRLRESLLLRLLLSARPGRTLLNVGAGQGTFSQLLETRDFEVTSVDPSPEAVDLLCARVRGAVLLSAAGELAFEDASFDGAVLGEVLEHIEDDLAALREVARVVRPGGVIAASVPANPAWFGPSDEWAGHHRRYTREALLELCAGTGLTVERLEPWGFPVSSFYHRRIYEPRLSAQGPAAPRWYLRPAVAALGAALQLDRLFVGVERRALGYLLLTRKPGS
jgi:SAM-dependent methyltransferase